MFHRDYLELYATLGWVTHPLRGKIPMSPKGWNTDINKNNFRKYWHGNEGYNYGLLCGEKSGVVVLDLDKMKPKDDPLEKVCGVETYVNMIDEHGPIDTVCAHTPSGGCHVYFKYDERTSKIISGNKRWYDENNLQINWDFKSNDANSGGSNNIVLPPSTVCKPYHKDTPISLNIGEFNIFKGFQATLVKTPDYSKIKPLLDHFFNVLCNKDQHLYNYLLSWIAHPLQELAMNEVILFIAGLPGAGKTMVFQFLCQWVYGPYTSVTLPHLEELMSDTNKIIVGKLLVYVEETGVPKNNFSTDFNRLKPLVTSKSLYVKEKYEKNLTVANVGSFIVTSNHDGVKVESGCRRWACYNSNDEYVGKKEYFNPIFDNCFNQECGDIMYTYLRKEVTMISLKNIPDTEYRGELINNGLAPHIKFLNECFTDETIAFPHQMFLFCSKNNQYYFKLDDFYDFYLHIIVKSNFNKSPIHKDIFSKELRKNKLVTHYGRIRINGLQTQCYMIDPSLNKTIIISNGPINQPLSDYRPLQ